ncbi:DUF1289 domain-containing protein [Acidovorax sp. GBBC 3334]|uniref:DUF1289 domain-containing protein n=1 Tax=Acidovorax sp. GBBC 3334 TaxID=2940496 RepID=UPI0023049AC7|nr:DUF1289 domain-containing protein [Acidovorax sp. GBBC 3334]MDA8453836.1 DUF1289 domain-containing protein [Acidovorax sp. GBBC 3334]
MNAIELIAEKAMESAASGLFDADCSAPPPSPCIGVCRMDAGGGYCEGCFRTLDDIRDWSAAGPAQRRAIWAALLHRAGLDGIAARP